jgi:hypothetical protein
MLAFAAPDQENGAIFLKRVSYDHRDPHIHENVRRQDRVTETARAERILSLRFGLKEWNRMREVGFVGGDENELSHTGLARGVDQIAVPVEIDRGHGIRAAPPCRICRGNDDIDSFACGGQRIWIL